MWHREYLRDAREVFRVCGSPADGYGTSAARCAAGSCLADGMRGVPRGFV